jgi:hypothetical protein
MSPARPVAASLLLVLGAVFIQAVQVPGRTLACSCVPLPSLPEIAANHSVVIARIGPNVGGGEGNRLTIERVFAGNVPVEFNVGGIGAQSAACEVGANGNERWLFAIYRAPDGSFGVSSCGLNAEVGTPAGDKLLAEVIATFGEGRGPAPPEDEPAPAAPDLSSWFAGIGWAAALGAVAMVIFGLVVFVARRQRPG